MSLANQHADKPLVVLKIDVDTYRGTREGVPNLVKLLQQHQAGATFLFSLGPDHTGWAMKRVFRKGFFSKVSRTSVVEHYGVKTLLYGTLLPGPDIGARCQSELRAVQQAGFECGIHTWDHVVWQDSVRHADAAWTRKQMQQSAKRFAQIFGHPPATHGAAGWQMNAHAFAELDQMAIGHASDGRAALDERGAMCSPGAQPYHLPDSRCIQMPTTLPTLDELLGREIDGHIITPANVAKHILKLTQENHRHHVYTLHAELEGQKLAPVLAQLIQGWQAQGYRCGSMADYAQMLDVAQLAQQPIQWGEIPGRSGDLIMLKSSP